MTTSEEKGLSIQIKEKAYSLGFDLCGIAASRPLKEHEPVLKKWCAAGMNGEMSYLARNFERRTNPDSLVNGAKSVIVTGLNYFTSRKQGGNGIPVLSRYAYGANYHDIIKRRLDKIIEFIRNIDADANGRSFVDSAPILEKAWAREAGLGWPGRHSILINRSIGSFFFIGVIVVDIELEYDKPFTGDYCDECRQCITLCPTAAINDDRTIDVRKCISYLTVENEDPVPEDISIKMEGRVFGCDICQEVCPWNRIAKPHNIPEFDISQELASLSREEWMALSVEKFNNLFKKSAVKRGKYERLIRNISMVSKI